MLGVLLQASAGQCCSLCFEPPPRGLLLAAKAGWCLPLRPEGCGKSRAPWAGRLCCRWEGVG